MSTDTQATNTQKSTEEKTAPIWLDTEEKTFQLPNVYNPLETKKPVLQTFRILPRNHTRHKASN